jgi:hypothetical protein
MDIMELAELYLETTRPSVLKEQKLNNIVDVMTVIRKKLDLQARNKKVRQNQLKRLALAR